MNLEHKTLLLMGGGAYANDIERYKNEMGFKIVAVGRDINTPISRLADKFYNVNTQDVEKVIDVVEREKVDGIFVGSSEINISPAITVSEQTNARFYATRKQWDILANKARFKEACIEAGVPVVPQYKIPKQFTLADIRMLPFPVLVKPVDSSGARGMSVCYSAKEFMEKYEEALKWSYSKNVLVEEYIMDAEEIFFQYNIQDGRVSLSSSFSKVFTESENKELILPIFHMYPSNRLDEYYEKVHPYVIKLFHTLKIQNGYMTLQSFYKNGKFYIFEAGYRMGGAQNYIFTDRQNDVNALHYMINYALVGKMSDMDISLKDNPYFKYPCCNYYVGLKPGIIKMIKGLDEIKKFRGVLNITKMAGVGDRIHDTNALERICLRIHVLGKNINKLAELLVKISKTLRIISEEGDEMQIEHLSFDRCYNAIENSVKILK